MPPLVFEPYGPFDLPFETLPRGRRIASDEAIAEWWEYLDYDKLGDARGVFVFSLRAGKGYTPYYVGKTSRQTFARECFTSHKRDKYNHALALQAGTPMLSLLAHPTRRGPVNHSAIDGLELELIQHAYARNPDELMNERRIEDLPIYSVAGVLRSGRGKPSKDARELKRILGFD
jgi:hypothetical protein